MGPDAHLLHYAIGGQRRVGELLRRRRDPEDLAAPGSTVAEVARGGARRLVPGLAPRRHRDDQRGGEPDLVGAVHGPPAAAVVPRPGGHPRRRRPRHASPPRAGRQHLHRGRLRPRRAARRGEGRHPGQRPSPGTRPCGAPAPARSSAAPRSPARCCTCPTARPRSIRNSKVARVPQDFGWIHEYDVQQELQKIGCAPAPSHRHPLDTGGSHHGRRTRYSANITTTLAVGRRGRPGEVTPETSFTDDLDIDSMTMLEVIVAARRPVRPAHPRRRVVAVLDRRRPRGPPGENGCRRTSVIRNVLVTVTRSTHSPWRIGRNDADGEHCPAWGPQRAG